MIIARVNGEDFLGFSKMGIKKDITNICNQFVITCTADQRFAFPIPRGASIEFEVEGTKIFTGSVEIINGRYGDGEYSISASGRDDSKIIVKTCLRPSFSIKGPIALDRAIKKTLSAHGITLDVINQAGTVMELSSKEVFTDDVGAKLYEFFVGLGKKRQVLISKNNDGDLILYRVGQNKFSTILQTRIEDKQNNILDADFSFDDSERVGEITVYSRIRGPIPGTQSPPDPVTGEIVPAIIAGQYTRGVAVDDAITDGSELHIKAEHPADNTECKSQAAWLINNARAKATRYTCSVADLLIDGVPWEPGYLVYVIDEIADINSAMLIVAVEYETEKNENGVAQERVNLTLTVPDAYSEDAGASQTSRNYNTIGREWNESDFQ